MPSPLPFLLSLASASDTVYDVLRLHGLPMGLLPRGVESFQIDGFGNFEVSLGRACTVKFENGRRRPRRRRRPMHDDLVVGEMVRDGWSSPAAPSERSGWGSVVGSELGGVGFGLGLGVGRRRARIWGRNRN